MDVPIRCAIHVLMPMVNNTVSVVAKDSTQATAIAKAVVLREHSPIPQQISVNLVHRHAAVVLVSIRLSVFPAATHH